MGDKARSGIEILESLKPEERLEMEKLTHQSWEEIYKNAQILEDVKGKKVATGIKNKVVKEVSEGVEKDDIFNELTNNGTGKDK